jgi:hypothetical protein
MAETPTNEPQATASESQNARFGLDKNARLATMREQQVEENRPMPLDPPFPYRLLSFDPNFVRRRSL